MLGKLQENERDLFFAWFSRKTSVTSLTEICFLRIDYLFIVMHKISNAECTLYFMGFFLAVIFLGFVLGMDNSDTPIH